MSVSTTGTERRYVEHYQGERKQDRTTPIAFFQSWHTKLRFTLDGAATAENALLPRYSTAENPVSWKGERVFCNPPWSNIPPFLEFAPLAELAMFLVPARVNARWFHRALDLGGRPEYFKPKLKFDGLKDNSPTDCLLIFFGEGGGIGQTLGAVSSSESLTEAATIQAVAGSNPALPIKCHKCGTAIDFATKSPELAVCQECCEDHNYPYIRREGRFPCEYCGKEPPND